MQFYLHHKRRDKNEAINLNSIVSMYVCISHSIVCIFTLNNYWIRKMLKFDFMYVCNEQKSFKN